MMFVLFFEVVKTFNFHNQDIGWVPTVNTKLLVCTLLAITYFERGINKWVI